MEELLILIIQLILEVLLNVFTVLPLEAFSYIGETEDSNTVPKCILLLFFGTILGLLSVFIFPKPMIQLSYLRVTNLLFSPLLAGFLSKAIAEFIHNRKDNVWPKRHFWYSFWLCLGYVAMRFVAIDR